VEKTKFKRPESWSRARSHTLHMTSPSCRVRTPDSNPLLPMTIQRLDCQTLRLTCLLGGRTLTTRFAERCCKGKSPDTRLQSRAIACSAQPGVRDIASWQRVRLYFLQSNEEVGDALAARRNRVRVGWKLGFGAKERALNHHNSILAQLTTPGNLVVSTLPRVAMEP
jgi:hypothetical protein